MTTYAKTTGKLLGTIGSITAKAQASLDHPYDSENLRKVLEEILEESLNVAYDVEQMLGDIS